jgi:hypothetical protein
MSLLWCSVRHQNWHFSIVHDAPSVAAKQHFSFVAVAVCTDHQQAGFDILAGRKKSF